MMFIYFPMGKRSGRAARTCLQTCSRRGASRGGRIRIRGAGRLNSLPFPAGPSVPHPSLRLINSDKYRIALLPSAHAPQTPRPSLSLAFPSSPSILRFIPGEEESNPPRKLCHILISLAMSPLLALGKRHIFNEAPGGPSRATASFLTAEVGKVQRQGLWSSRGRCGCSGTGGSVSASFGPG